ncbi:oxidoreductase [Paenibacillus sp. MY03]|uniref:Gfo/Idh/MocA family protein n=1 Tax=Paenibacillus sp. MY03 TaxID=302980 RepID=UPI000B3C92CB|nr:Gfo/Idh/MocA family oxidoreductase [Paenibacillus sp. MY03]OUS76469.1 oxidoreductase [Paenibacillus sp. MY03]
MEFMRLGVIGLGNMGKGHIRYILKGDVPGAKLTAVSDNAEAGRQWAKDNVDEGVSIYADPYEMMDSGKVDGILIATPHYSHPELAIACFERGLHVMVEKPAGVFTKQVREMNDAYAKTDVKFSMMYNQRTNPLYRKVKDLVDSGELGEIRRTNWIITNWYRSQSYYDSGKWRATWEGEGGGVLLNQDPHQLDLWQWTISMMPKRVRAFCYFGKHRDIEVEDDVTAFVEYENGATGVFVTTTGESPGTNRLEISGDRGKVVIEDNKLTFWRLRESEREFNANFKGGFGQPECWKCDVPIVGENSNHRGIMRNWTNAILHGEELIAPGEEGIKGLMLSNAMLLSTWIDNWVDLPIDEELYYAQLQERIESSRYRKRT